MTKTNRPTHIRVLNLAGPEFDADRDIVISEIKRLPELFEFSPSDAEQMLWRFHDKSPQIDKDKLLEKLRDQVGKRLEDLHHVVLLAEDPHDESDENVDYDIAEPLGWYSPDARKSVRLKNLIDAITAKLASTKAEDRAALKDLETKLNDKSVVPIVALIMKRIDADSVKWRAKGRPAPQCSDSPHSKREWLTVKVLRHELGHHVFPLDSGKYASYKTDKKVEKLAEGGANFYSWLIGTDEERSRLALFAREQRTEEQQPGPYEAYLELLSWAMPSGSHGTNWVPGLAVPTCAWLIGKLKVFLDLPSDVRASDIKKLIASINKDKKQPNWLRPQLEAAVNCKELSALIAVKVATEAVEDIINGSVKISTS